MNSILNKLTSVKKKKEQKEEKRPVIAVPPSVVEPFLRLVGASAIEEVVTARKEVEKGIVDEVMLNAYADSLYEYGRQPTNPKLEVTKDGRPDISGIFQVQQRYKFNIRKEGDESVRSCLVNQLVVAGISQQEANALPIDDIGVRIISSLVESGVTFDSAKEIFEKEMDCTPRTTLRPFNELALGHYVNKQFVEATEVEKKVAEKLVNFVTGEKADFLTPEELEVALERVDSIKVKDGFLERLKNYCKDAKEVKAVFKIIAPVHFVSHMKFGISDTPEEKYNRLVDEMKKILGES